MGLREVTERQHVLPGLVHQFSPLLAGELTLLGRAKVTPINPGLPDPLGKAADGQSQPLGHSPAAEVFAQAELNSFLLLLRRELAS